MYSITINAKNIGELTKIAAVLAGETVQGPEKTLADFPLQDIVQHLNDKGYSVNHAEPSEPKLLHELMAEDEAKATKAKSAKNKQNKKVDTADTVSSDTPEEAEVADDVSEDPAALKDAAIKKIMAEYETPRGKKVAGELLKQFAVRNFHLVPEDKWAEFHKATMAAFA